MLDRLHPRTWFVIALCIAIAGIYNVHATTEFLATARYADAARVSFELQVVRQRRGAYVLVNNIVEFTASDGHPYECELTTSRLQDHYWIAYPPGDPSACRQPPRLLSDALAFVFFATIPTIAGVVRMLALRRRPA